MPKQTRQLPKKRLCVETLRKVKEPSRTAETENNLDNLADESLAGYFYNEEDFNSFIRLVAMVKKCIFRI